MIKSICRLSANRRGYSSVVEHSTADREVPGSNPGVPCLFFVFLLFDGSLFRLK